MHDHICRTNSSVPQAINARSYAMNDDSITIELNDAVTVRRAAHGNIGIEHSHVTTQRGISYGAP